MTSNKLEQEAKFWIDDLKGLESRLKKLGAVLVQERTHELNLRFDTPDRQLSGSFQVLRLRQDRRCRLTYKGPGDPSRSISAREEIEVEVSNLQTAREILEALGYQVMITYEKYRTAYLLNDAEISLDEMPFGTFSEIEGLNEENIRATAVLLEMNWDAHSSLSYLTIFSILKDRFSLEMNDLTFEAFQGVTVSLEEIGLKKADQ